MIGDTPASLGAVAKAMARNPIIIACLLGILLNVTGIGLHPLISEGLDLLARGALALGLLAVGAGLRVRAVREQWGALLLSNAMKLVVVPGLTLALAVPLGLTGTPLAVAVLFNALPSSASSYVFARNLGGDAELMAAILSTQVILSAISIPVFLSVL